MRKPLICLLSISFFLQACTKDINYTTVAGKYRLTKIAGGFTGAATKFSILDQHILQLNRDSSYIRDLPGYGLPIIKDTGTYSIGISLSGDERDTIITMSSSLMTTSYGMKITDHTMHLYMIDYSEGFTQTYVKIGN